MDNMIKWTLLLLALFGVNLLAHADLNPDIALNTPIAIRASDFGYGHIGIAVQTKTDDRILAIICEQGWSREWSGNLILPNEKNEVRVLLDTSTNISGAARSPNSPRLPLEATAAKNICPNPNGHYKIRVAHDAKGAYTVYYDSGVADPK